MGVWIETNIGYGLRYWQWVTPCVGVWIETMAQARASMMNAVTPCVGVWIETLRCNLLGGLLMSHPAWVCGLKHSKAVILQVR